MEIKDLNCQYCSKKFSLKVNIYRHIKEVHLKENIKKPCPYCKRLYTRHLDEHIKRCLFNPTILKLNFCKKFHLIEIYKISNEKKITNFLTEIYNNFLDKKTNKIFKFINKINYLHKKEDYKIKFEIFQEEQKKLFYECLKNIENNSDLLNNNISNENNFIENFLNNTNIKNNNKNISIKENKLFIEENNIFNSLNSLTNKIINIDNKNNSKYLCLICFKSFSGKEFLVRHLFHLGISKSNSVPYCIDFQEEVISKNNLNDQIIIIEDMLKYSFVKLRNYENLNSLIKEELKKNFKNQNLIKSSKNFEDFFRIFVKNFDCQLKGDLNNKKKMGKYILNYGLLNEEESENNTSVTSSKNNELLNKKRHQVQICIERYLEPKNEM